MSFRRRTAITFAITLFALAMQRPTGAHASGRTSAPLAAPAPLTVTIEMKPISFQPAKLSVKVGQKVTIKFVNNNNVAHEAFVGNIDEQVKHDKQMKAGEDHAAHMTKGYVLVKPGETKSFSYTFTKRGRTVIGCHQPGHWKSGMRIDVVVQ